MDKTLKTILLEGRTHHTWLDKPVDDQLLKQAYDMARMGPTSTNCLPMRIHFVKSREAKERLRPSLDEGNVNQTMTAPITAILGYDMTFYDSLPRLFPHNATARSWFAGNEALCAETAFRNGSLQGAYFLMALRAVGLDCGPMSGFDRAKVDQEFFKDTSVRSNFLCNIGYGEGTKLFPRSPRFDFEEVCQTI